MKMEVLAILERTMDGLDLQHELELLHATSYGWALACCRQNKDEAEDVLHTAYLKVLEGRARFEGRSSFRTWFFGVIRHTAVEQHRRQWLRDALLKQWFSGQFFGSAEFSAVPEAGANSSVLWNALNQLPQRQRQVLHLVFYQDLTIEEAASVLGVSLGTARTHFDRGKKRLRQLLAATEEVADARRS